MAKNFGYQNPYRLLKIALSLYVSGFVCLLYQQEMQKEWKEHFIKSFLLKAKLSLLNKQVDVGEQGNQGSERVLGVFIITKHLGIFITNLI